MAKKRRVPEVLWRLFHNRARTLADTIVSLIPPSPLLVTDCRCKGRRCLACSGDGAMSFLLRPDDPCDYRKLLTQCFVVVSDNAPPLSAFSPHRRWSQREIVKRAIEMMMCEQPSSRNVLCSDYDTCHHSSPAVELLTGSSWGILLRRIGDGVMFYLLKYTSIFLPLPQKKHFQVSGFPISDVCFKTKHVSEPKHWHSSLVLGSGKKRKRIDGVDLMLEKQQPSIASGDNVTIHSISCFGCSLSYPASFSRHHGKISHQMCSSGEATLNIGTANPNNEENRNGEHEESSKQTIEKPRKRLRQFSWQRHRRNRQLDFQIPLQCSCCLGLQTLQYATKESQIDRQSMFYKLESSSSVLPRKHVLNSLKSNFSDANVLFKDIFGSYDAAANAPPKLCFHGSNCCLMNHQCLYHSLIKLLKSLIRKAQCCQHLRLLEKHCSIPSLDPTTEGKVCSTYESVKRMTGFVRLASLPLLINGNKMRTNSLAKQHARVRQHGNFLFDEFSHFDTIVGKRSPETTDHQFVPSRSYCLKKQVVSFIWAVCRSIVPPDLLGTSYNSRILRRNISRFVRLRRFEKFSLKQCMYKLKTSMFPLLSNKHSSCYSNDVQSARALSGYNQVKQLTDTVKHKIVEKWIFWFFTCLVVPLVQANFYVTESEHGKQDVFYYQKPIWEKVMNNAVMYLKEWNYRPLNDQTVRSIISKRSFGFSRVRLRPKENGVRPLANLQASSKIPVKECSLNIQRSGLLRKASLRPKHAKYDYFMSVNGVLRDLHAILKGLQIKEPEKLGSSVFDYNDVYKKLCPFLSVLKNGSTTVPAVFIVVADVSKAFDSVIQDKLLDVMNDVMKNDEYLIKKSHQVVCVKKSLWVHQNLILADQDINIGSAKPACNYSFHGVLVNQGWSRNIRKEVLCFNLNEHVKHNVLQLDNNYYLQDVGIPQGSVLSSLLCSFYYGHLETNVIIPFLQKTLEPAGESLSESHNGYGASAVVKSSDTEVILSSSKYMLCRFIDDFLFISTSKKQATRFFSRLQRGFREYNCYMNEGKFGLNFDIDHLSRLTSNRFYMGEDGIPFLRWSGLFINCRTLEIQADYTRYLDTHINSTLTVRWLGKPGQHLKAKLCDYLRPKCHPIFYDSNINSAAVVRLNIYQAFLLCAMKFHCYVYDLSNICKLGAPSYICSIERSFRYMHKLIKKRMYSMGHNSNFRPIFQVEKQEVEWLGLMAYIRALKRKQSRHKELLSLLRSKLTEHETERSFSSSLKYAVDDSHSSMMWKIKY